AVGECGISHEQIRVHHAASATDLDAILQAAELRPTVLDDPDTAAGEFDEADGVLFAAGAIAVKDPAPHLGEDGHRFLFETEHPSKPGEAVAAHVHQRATA